MSRRKTRRTGKVIGEWSPTTGSPSVRPVPATGPKRPKPAIPTKVVVEVRASVRHGRMLPKGGPRNLLRALAEHRARALTIPRAPR